MTAPPAIPPPTPRLRADGTVKGPSRRSALWVLGVGLALFLAAAAVVAPAFFDSVSGPRFEIPGERTLDLDDGTWAIYQHTGRSRGASAGGFVSGGVTFDEHRPITIRPQDVGVAGPAPAEVWSGGFGETITRGSATYSGAVRFRVPEPGRYTVAVADHMGAGGEVLVARPVSELFSSWPWMVAGGIGSLLVVAGLAMWLVGAGNRRVARRAGIPV